MWSDDKLLRQAAANGTRLVPLNDFFYDTLIPAPFKAFPDAAADATIAVTLVFAIVFSVASRWVAGVPDPLRHLRRSLAVLVAVYFARAISISSTQVPPSNPAFCRYFPIGAGEIIEDSLNELTSNLKSCSDMMFSGHTSMISVVLVRIWCDVNILNARFWRYLIRFCMLCLYLFALGVFVGIRLHYSMDAWIGLLLALSWSIGLEVSCDMVQHFEG
ncbi:hypothetical protein HK100_009885, partial [Physocladia obscura]